MATVNRLLREARALPQLVKHDQWDWHLHATTPEAPLADRMGTEAAMALVDVIRSKEMDRMLVCAAEDCDAVVLDLSRNRSKRYCDTGNCANRAHVAAYRATESARRAAAARRRRRPAHRPGAASGAPAVRSPSSGRAGGRRGRSSGELRFTPEPLPRCAALCL